MERTLRRPTFQPPGSVFKPFLAAYGLDKNVRIDPDLIVSCIPLNDGTAGYVDVHCWSEGGHGDVSLDLALKHSCNSYFAWLGETLTDEDLHRAAAIFGFGQPTGVASPPYWDPSPEGRSGLREATSGFREGALGDHDRRMAGNGLGVIEATPMQLARAMLALATGELKDLRLVQRIGDVDLPPGTSRRLPLEEESLRRVRAALKTVTQETGGTGYQALNPHVLGYSIAAKTGSADYTTRANADGKVRKHTWVAGWAPADDPEIVFVIFVHDTIATSSHGAVYLARELLKSSEVLGYLADHGVDAMGDVEAR
jgi:penicillin-binding protein 2